MAIQLTTPNINERTEAIRREITPTGRRTTFHGYKGESIELPVIRISTDMLVYRMANFRTQIAQLKWAKSQGLSKDFFLNGENDPTSQEVQHYILLEKSKIEKGDIAAIYDVLEKNPKQTEPILITVNGVVVNGNRRLSAMRDLYLKDPNHYSSFSYIDCMVLPESTSSRDIEEIEVQLQMAKETKLPYDWLDKCLAVRKLTDEKLEKSRIRQLMQMNSDDDVDALITQIHEVDIYLTDYLGMPEEYHLVQHSQQIFSELEKSLKQKDSLEKESRRMTAHVIIANSDETEGRLYDSRGAFGKYNEEVLTRLCQELDIKTVPANNQIELEIDFGESTVTFDIFALKPILQDKEQSKDLTNKILDILEDVIEEGKETKATKKALTLAARALKDLGRIEKYPLANEYRENLIITLYNIEEQTKKLLTGFVGKDK